ncbi:efflux RND transporter periplasmic adaptor subunit [Methylocystis heyeri]|uniref:Efflux RND transporter periplasmic adaptor subunit n=1 Tax=Methylocystis heyeri TaxID=391905 RepID=A0A6B8KBG8_9HYPH|nr:efflux RND transporter periplasmic adaptor subunit [Methylocystis heyeri]QGM45506.1 efflux RND transporter periplasmic adaptor subunit [Methylocystis heyeri]
MNRDKKTLALYGAFVVLALFAFYKGYSLLRGEKPEQAQKAAAEASAPGELAVDLNEKQVAAIKSGEAGSKSFAIERKAVGNIDFNQNMLTQVFTPYQGRIINAYPNVGDKVEKDQVLFTIDSPDLLTAESTLIAAAGVLKLQNATLSRAQKMKSFGGASQQAVDQSTSDQQTAEGALKSARDAVRIFGKTDAEIDKIIQERKADPRLIVKSPMTGYVTSRNAAPGLFVQPGVAPAPFIVADLSTMWMLANIPESDTPDLRVGQEVRARVAAYPDREFKGKISVMGASVDPNTRRVFVRSEVEDPDHSLRAGMFANFVIGIGDSKEGVAVPTTAVVREGDGSMTIWIVKSERHFVRRTVTLGHQQDGFYEIVEGLQPGEKIVTEGAIFLSNILAGGAD